MLVDPDPAETREWLEALDSVLEFEGTDRAEQLLDSLLAEGRSNQAIGERLFLSPKTVEFHLSRIYRKLEINSRAALMRLALS